MSLPHLVALCALVSDDQVSDKFTLIKFAELEALLACAETALKQVDTLLCHVHDVVFL